MPSAFTKKYAAETRTKNTTTTISTEKEYEGEVFICIHRHLYLLLYVCTYILYDDQLWNGVEPLSMVKVEGVP